MSNWKKQTLMSSVIVSILMVSSWVAASPGGPERLHKALDLSDAQQATFKQLHDESKQDRQANREARKAMQQRIKQLMQNYSVQEAEQLAQQMAQLEREKALQRFAHMHSLMEILDESQQQKFIELMDEKAKARHKRAKHKDMDR